MTNPPSDQASSGQFSNILFGALVIAALTAAITYYSGIMTERWSSFSGLDEAGKRLREIPMTIGDWTASEELSLAKDEINALQIKDRCIVRRYQNKKTRDEINFVLMVGPTGKLVVHTPEICFGGREYEKSGERTAEKFPIADADPAGPTDDYFWKVVFNHRAATGSAIVFYYAIGTGNSWVASENPRSEFERRRFVFKMQAEAYHFDNAGTSDHEKTEATKTDSAAPKETVQKPADSVAQFLRDALPVIRKYTAPPAH